MGLLDPPWLLLAVAVAPKPRVSLCKSRLHLAAKAPRSRLRAADLMALKYPSHRMYIWRGG